MLTWVAGIRRLPLYLKGGERPWMGVDARTGSRLRVGDVFLARVVDFPWGSEIVGRAAGVLPTNRGQEVARAAQKVLKAGPVDCATLRSHRGSRVVIKGWAAAVKLRRAAAKR